MKNNPKFTVLLPAKGRPALAREALISVLNQSYKDFEVIVSNNGADLDVKAAIENQLTDSRVIYIEHKNALPMPEHWENISLLAKGEYLTVLPDRSVLKQNALETLCKLHDSGGEDAKVISWPWDLYYDNYNLLLPYKSLNKDNSNLVLESPQLLLNSLASTSNYPCALPRALNSSVSLDVIKTIREKCGAAFLPMSPDYKFAFACLMITKRITHLNSPLMISQGLNVSNGGNAYLTDSSKYLDTLGIANLINYSPIKNLFVENCIAEDFFSTCHMFNRVDLIAKIDISNLYIKCLLELHEKKAAKISSPEQLKEFSESIFVSLAKERSDVRNKVDIYFNNKASRLNVVKILLKSILKKHIAFLRPFLLKSRGAVRFDSALIAAGHHQK